MFEFVKFARLNHPTHICPTLQEDDQQQVNYFKSYYGSQQRRYDSYSNTYNPEWSFSYGATQQYYQPWQHQPQHPSSSDPGMSLKEIIKSLAILKKAFRI